MKLPYGLTGRFVVTNLAVGTVGGFVLTLLRTQSLTAALLAAPMGAIGYLGVATLYDRYERDRARAREQRLRDQPSDEQR